MQKLDRNAAWHLATLIFEMLIWVGVILCVIALYGTVRAASIHREGGPDLTWHEALNYKTEGEK